MFQNEKLSLKFQPRFRNLCIDTADAIVVMYSVTDKNSFHVARETLDWLAMEFTSDMKTGETKFWHHPITCPVILLANKADLSHLRNVSGCICLDLTKLNKNVILNFEFDYTKNNIKFDLQTLLRLP